MKKVPHLFRVVMEIDQDFRYSRSLECLQPVGHQRLSTDGQQTFWSLLRQFAKPAANPGRQQNSLHAVAAARSFIAQSTVCWSPSRNDTLGAQPRTRLALSDAR